MTAVKLKRFSTSSAYIDSGAVAAFVAGVVTFAVWVGLETSQVVSPVWLAASIIGLVIYQLAIFWLIRQYWEINQILGIFVSNILCFSLVAMLVEFAADVTLPSHLPVLSLIAHAAGYSFESLSPGSVALSYAVIALFAGLAALFAMLAFERLNIYKVIVKGLRLDRVDLFIDYHLDRYSFWVSNHKYAWLVVPQVLLVVVLVIVVGLAAVLM